MKKNSTTTIITSIVTELIKSSSANMLVDLTKIINNIDKSKKDTNEKINHAFESLRTTSTLIDELRNELTEKTKNIQKLQEDYDQYSKLADIEHEKIKPLLVQLEKTMNKGRGNERWISFLINILAGILIFALGMWIGPKITAYIGS